MDTVDKETRSRIMSSVGQKDTGPETLLRYALHKAGLRYRPARPHTAGQPRSGISALQGRCLRARMLLAFARLLQIHRS